MNELQLGSTVGIETQLICYVLGRGEPSRDLGIKSLDWQKLLKLASNNRVIYPFAKALITDQKIDVPDAVIKILGKIITQSEERLEILAETIRTNERILTQAGIPFVLAKTDRGAPYVTFDIDVLIPPDKLEIATEAFQRAGAKTGYNSHKDESDVAFPNHLLIDLHTGFFCHGHPYASAESMWPGMRQVELQGLQVPVPSINAELALMIGHSLHERFNIPMLEFFYLRDNYAQADWDVIESQAAMHGSRLGMSIYQRIAGRIDRALYPAASNPMFSERRTGTGVRIPGGKLTMPYMFTPLEGLGVLAGRTRPWRVSPYDIGHYFWTSFRYFRTRGRRVPIYYHWFDFEGHEWN